jgi:16S rRNA (uracil1498-N3)-methyltransferase
MHLFYQEDFRNTYFENEEARHCAKVLRLGNGDTIHITDGKGRLSEAVLTKVSPNRVEYAVREQKQIPLPPQRVHMAVCPTRKAERNEWMVEKLTELGVHKIHFVVSEHTHRETINRVVNQERLHRIALSAMKQSLQYYLPEIAVFSSFEAYLAQVQAHERYIAYVTDQDVPPHLYNRVSAGPEIAVLIGPEGDFSKQEIEHARSAGFEPVSLGPTRLRTETAAVIACHSAVLKAGQTI